jgi:type IV fimbrial biogenesis protein FimT
MNHPVAAARTAGTTTPARRQRGFTLVEGLIVMTIVALSLSTAVPSFRAAMERRHLEGAAAQLETDIQLVRSLAVAQNRSVRMNFSSDAHGSCYMAFNGAASDCQCSPGGAPVCNAAQSIARHVGFETGGALRLNSNVTSIVFDPQKGTTTPTGTLRFQSRSGQALHLVVNIMGRVRACSPTGLTGYKPC